MTKSAASAHTLAELREAYEAGEALAVIARRFAIAPSTLRARARRLGWQRLSMVKPIGEISSLDASADAQSGTACSALSACIHRSNLHTRLYTGLERRIEAFAARVARPADVERDAKVLTALVQTLQRLADMDASLVIPSDVETRNDAALIHEELARRLSRFTDQAEKGPLSQEPEQS